MVSLCISHPLLKASVLCIRAKLQLAEVQSKLDLTEAELARLRRQDSSQRKDEVRLIQRVIFALTFRTFVALTLRSSVGLMLHIQGDMPVFMKAHGAPQRAQRSAAPPPQPGSHKPRVVSASEHVRSIIDSDRLRIRITNSSVL